MRTSLLNGYSFDEVKEVSSLLTALLDDELIPADLATMALCRAIITVCPNDRLDLVCTLLDNFAEENSHE